MKLNELIRIAREVTLLVVLLIICYRLAFTDFSVNLGTLSATDIVAILLAFFSIALAAAFYFKSSEVSNRFYDNMNKFTQDTSVILGKIESKFGEQLRNIEEKSADLKASVERYYTRSESSNASEEAQTDAQRKVSETKQQYDEIIENILSKAQLDATEKGHLKKLLNEKEQQILDLQTQISEQQSDIENELKPRVKRHFKRIVSQRLRDAESDALSAEEMVLHVIQKAVAPFRRDLKRLGYIDTMKPTTLEDVTEEGMELFMSLLHETLNESDA